MRDAAIAFHRFGLGAVGGAAAPADPRAWLKDQLARFEPRPAAIAALPNSGALITMLRTAREDQVEYKKDQEKGANDPEAERIPRPFRTLRDQYVAAVGARASVALSSPAPFAERLVHFWSNHFAVSVDKLVTIGLAGPFEFEAIRPNILGNFADLLLAVESHPAMLLYLDQAQSIGPGSTLGAAAQRRGRDRGLNENLAREILELHTLGVRSGYSQTDVTELARALTGWTVAGLVRMRQIRENEPGFYYFDGIHEPGTRTLLGKRYSQSGQAQARAMLADLALHPATARHLSTKLARHFAGDDPPPALVTRLEQAYLKSGGNLPTLYRVLVDSPECWSGPPKFRTPWEWTIAALRATGVKALPGASAATTLQQLGQAVWKPGSPAGFADTAPNWAGPDALYRRVEVAQRIAQRTAAAIDARALAPQLFPGALSEATATALARAESGEQALALLLSSPEMMRR